MGEPRNVPAVSIPEAESFRNDGIAAGLAEPTEKLTNHLGVDMPGVGLVPEGEDSSLEAQTASPAHWRSDADQKPENHNAVPRENLLAKLISAARNLAHHNIELGISIGPVGTSRICGECFMEESLGVLTHTPSCWTGKVLDIIAALCDNARNSLSKSQTKEAVSAEKNASAGAGMRSCGNYGEPWNFLGASRQREDAYIGMGERSTFQTIVLHGVFGVREAALRAIACVNFCRNLSDAELDRPPLVPWQRERGEPESQEVGTTVGLTGGAQ